MKTDTKTHYSIFYYSETILSLWVMRTNVNFKSAPASGVIFYVPISPSSQKVWQHTFLEVPLEAVLVRSKK